MRRSYRRGGTPLVEVPSSCQQPLSSLHISGSKQDHGGRKRLTACSMWNPGSRNHVSHCPYQVWHEEDIFVFPLWPSHNSRSDSNAHCVTGGFLHGWQASYHLYAVQWYRASHEAFTGAFKIRVWHDTHRWAEWRREVSSWVVIELDQNSGLQLELQSFSHNPCLATSCLRSQMPEKY